MKTKLLYTILVIIIAAISAGIAYAIPAMQVTDISHKLQVSRQEAEELQTKLDQFEGLPTSLATAINMLPNPMLARGGREISDNLYWVWGVQPFANGSSGRSNYSWVVDVKNATTVERIVREDTSPMEPDVGTNMVNETYFRASWENGWEGFWSTFTDYFDRNTGKAELTLENHMGLTAVAKTDDKRIEITYDPVDGCKNAVTDPDKVAGTITGLTINDTSYPFDRPVVIECIKNEMHGEGYYPEFSYWLFAEGDETLQLGLPWDDYVTIPYPELDPEQMEYVE